MAFQAHRYREQGRRGPRTEPAQTSAVEQDQTANQAEAGRRSSASREVVTRSAIRFLSVPEVLDDFVLSHGTGQPGDDLAVLPAGPRDQWREAEQAEALPQWS